MDVVVVQREGGTLHLLGLHELFEILVSGIKSQGLLVLLGVFSIDTPAKADTPEPYGLGWFARFV